MEPERSKMMPIETGASSLAKLAIFCSPLFSKTWKVFLLQARHQPVHGIGHRDRNQHHIHIHADARAGMNLQRIGPVSAGASAPLGFRWTAWRWSAAARAPCSAGRPGLERRRQHKPPPTRKSNAQRTPKAPKMAVTQVARPLSELPEWGSIFMPHHTRD
jgi:hypothetical protein